MMNASLVQRTSVRDETLAILTRLGATESALAGEGIPATSPITGELITHIRITRPRRRRVQP
jgi:aldehyde dehydrogenase (NAD+)